MRAANCTATWTLTTLGALALAGGLAWGGQGGAAEPRPRQAVPERLPWAQAGLTERQAAAHLLNRFAFGPRPGEVDQVVAMGLDRWVEQQLAADLPDPNLDARLRDLPALAMSQADMVRIYRNPNQILQQAVKEGVIDKRELAAAKADQGLKKLYARGNPGGNGGAGNGAGGGGNGAGGGGAAGADAAEIERPELRAKVLEFARARGYRPERELQGQLLAQKVLRAAESQDQLREVMTDFWFNHFNVSATNGRARPYLLSFERDAIRPNALGSVRGLLEATARHPAMLYYLDNAESTAAPDAPTLLGDEMRSMRRPAGRFGYGPPPPSRPAGAPKGHGLNENYARELMELHTLGVDGGYSQRDVIEVARAFTGWTVLPSGPAREAVEKRLERVRRFGGLGFQVDGDFLFRADMHDSAAKTVLGRSLPPGRGIEDGEQVLDLLASQPSTARHLSTQLAVRFVSDNPPRALVDRLVATYDRSRGDVRAMLRTLVQSPEFWGRGAVGAKVKSPFELAVSAVRASGAPRRGPAAAARLDRADGRAALRLPGAHRLPGSRRRLGEHRIAAQSHELRPAVRVAADPRHRRRPAVAARRPRARVAAGGAHDLRRAAAAGARPVGDPPAADADGQRPGRRPPRGRCRAEGEPAGGPGPRRRRRRGDGRRRGRRRRRCRSRRQGRRRGQSQGGGRRGGRRNCRQLCGGALRGPGPAPAARRGGARGAPPASADRDRAGGGSDPRLAGVPETLS